MHSSVPSGAKREEPARELFGKNILLGARLRFQNGQEKRRRSRRLHRWLCAIGLLSPVCPDCRISNAVIVLRSNNRMQTQTCLTTFGSEGSQATLPDGRAARVMR